MSKTNYSTLVDIHHHIIPDVYREGLAEIGITHSGGKSIDPWNVGMSLDFMDSLHIETAFMSISEPALREVYVQSPEKAKTLARKTNEFMASSRQQYPDRFGAFAVLPMPDVAASIEEVKYALDVLKLDGVGLLSNYEESFLGDSCFDELMDVLQQYKAVVYVHPSSPASSIKRPEFVPIDFITEFTFNTTRAATNLIYSATMERCPNVQFIFSHMGGTLPYLHSRVEFTFPRMEHVREAMPVSNKVKDRWAMVEKSISSYIKQMWFDTALNVDSDVLRLTDKIAKDHILFGSDAFFAPRPVVDKLLLGLKNNLSSEEFNKMANQNIKALFPDRRFTV